MNDQQWKTLMDIILPKLFLDIGRHLQRFKMLGPVLWDLVQQSIILSSEESSAHQQLDLGFVLRFLIRNLTADSLQRDKSSLGLVSALCQQPQAHQLRPRISAIDPSVLSNAFQVDLTLQLKSTAVFDVRFPFSVRCTSSIIKIFILFLHAGGDANGNGSIPQICRCGQR